MIKKILIFYLLIFLMMFILKIILMNYQRKIKQVYKYLPQNMKKIDKSNIDKQHEPNLGNNINEYANFTWGFLDHPNDIDFKLADLKNNMKIIDAGCGLLGPSIHFCSKIVNSKIYAISNGLPKHQKIILNNIKKNNLKNRIIPIFSDYNLIDKKFKKESIDRIIFIESIGFSDNIINLLKKCFKVLKPGGKIYIRTIVIPNLNNKYLSNQFNEIEKKLNGKLYFYQNIIYYLQRLKFKNIKTTTIPLFFTDNSYKLEFAKTIRRLDLDKWDKILSSYFLLSTSYIATK